MRGECVWTNWIKIFTQNSFTRAFGTASPDLATFQEACCTIGFLDFVDLYLFRANISDLYPPDFILLICSMQHLVKYCQCYGSAYHCFSTFRFLDFVDLYLFRAYLSVDLICQTWWRNPQQIWLVGRCLTSVGVCRTLSLRPSWYPVCLNSISMKRYPCNLLNERTKYCTLSHHKLFQGSLHSGKHWTSGS